MTFAPWEKGFESSPKKCESGSLMTEREPMRTTLTLDDELLAKAQAFTGLTEKSAIVREALRALIQRESARRLARLGGAAPDLEATPRRRPWEG